MTSVERTVPRRLAWSDCEDGRPIEANLLRCTSQASTLIKADPLLLKIVDPASAQVILLFGPCGAFFRPGRLTPGVVARSGGQDRPAGPPQAWS
jgi:hypothetical protein